MAPVKLSASCCANEQILSSGPDFAAQCIDVESESRLCSMRFVERFYLCVRQAVACSIYRNLAECDHEAFRG